MMLNNSLIKIVLSERDKKILVIIFLVFLLLVLLFGILNRLLNSYMKKEGKKIDQYLAGYVKYKFVNNTKEYCKIGFQKNQLLLFKQLLFPTILATISLIAFAIFCSIRDLKWDYIGQVYADMFFKLSAPTTKIFGITVFSSWPHIVPGSIVFHGDLDGIVAYIFLICLIVSAITIILSTIKFIARENRIKKTSKKIFETNLDLPINID